MRWRSFRTYVCAPLPWLVVGIGWALTGLSAPGQTGDFNQDGAWDCHDVDQLVAEVVAGSHGAVFDLDADGLVSQTDVTAWLHLAGGQHLASGESYLYGDANLDGWVDLHDLNRWRSFRFSKDASGFCQGDWNADGRVDVVDSLVWHANAYLFYPSLPGSGNAGLARSGTAKALYDPESGALFLATRGTEITGVAIAGPEVESLVDLPEFYFAPDGAGGRQLTVWEQTYHAGQQQWSGTAVRGAHGADGIFYLANYPPGLSEEDFGMVTYGGFRDLSLTGPGTIWEIPVQFGTILPGDANLDGFVDLSDFNRWNASKFETRFSASWGNGDFNGDGFIDTSDFNLWNVHKFRGVNTVPEPQGGVLLGLLAVLGLFRAQR